MKNVAMKMKKTAAKMPTIANTKPEATLFCKKDVLEAAAPGLEEADEDDSTTTVVRVIERGIGELVLSSIEEVVDEVERTTDEETGLDDFAEADNGVGLDDDEVVFELVALPLVGIVVDRGSNGSLRPGRIAFIKTA